MCKFFDFLDVEENKRINEFDKKLQFLYDQKSIPSFNIFNNPSTIELNEEKDELFIKTCNETIIEIKNNSLDDYLISEDEFKNIYFINIKRNRKSIFDITKEKSKKEKCKKGRLKIGEIPDYDVKHNKFVRDDIIQKIKVKVINGLYSLINKINSDYDLTKKSKNQPLLIKINSEKYKVYSNENNYKFLYSNIGDFFSAEVTKRYSTYPKDFNKIQINLVKKENKKINVIKILNSSIKEMYEKYINNEIPEFSLDNDLIEIENKNGKEYKEKYKKIALELIEFINKKVKNIEN